MLPVFLLLSCGGGRKKVVAKDSAAKPVEWHWELVASYPHDPMAYTQGLFWHEGRLWESTGLTGRSALREVEVETGRTLRETAVEGDYFAEGAVMFGGRIYQLTWQDGVVLTYNPETLEIDERYPLQGEGWGLTTDGKMLYMSDGTAFLTVVDPAEGFTPKRQMNTRQRMLNELEWIEGKIWANVYMSNRIVVIDPSSGRVKAFLDMGSLDAPAGADVLNGIAYDPVAGRIFVTGKLWDKVYEIRVIRPIESEGR